MSNLTFRSNKFDLNKIDFYLYESNTEFPLYVKWIEYKFIEIFISCILIFLFKI